MKLIIASDIHGSEEFCNHLMDRISECEPDRIVLLGDLLYHGPRNDLPKKYLPKAVIPLLNCLKDRVIAVRGNCEAEVDQMVLEFPCMADYSTVLLEKGPLLFATHGHVWDPDNLPPLSENTLFCYGHTHVKQLERIGSHVFLNPGSVSIPKDGSHSYAILEGDNVTLNNLVDGSILKELRL